MVSSSLLPCLSWRSKSVGFSMMTNCMKHVMNNQSPAWMQSTPASCSLVFSSLSAQIPWTCSSCPIFSTSAPKYAPNEEKVHWGSPFLMALVARCIQAIYVHCWTSQNVASDLSTYQSATPSGPWNFYSSWRKLKEALNLFLFIIPQNMVEKYI